jgi:hypothetical protein
MMLMQLRSITLLLCFWIRFSLNSVLNGPEGAPNEITECFQNVHVRKFYAKSTIAH